MGTRMLYENLYISPYRMVLLPTILSDRYSKSPHFLLFPPVLLTGRDRDVKFGHIDHSKSRQTDEKTAYRKGHISRL